MRVINLIIFICLGISFGLSADAETVQCTGQTVKSPKKTVRLDFESKMVGRLGLENADGSPYITWGTPRLERRHRGNKIIYRDPFIPDGWLLSIRSKEVGGENLVGELSVRSVGYSKLPLVCSIRGAPQPPVAMCGVTDADLIAAAKNGDVRELERVLECDVDVNYEDALGCVGLLYTLDLACGYRGQAQDGHPSDPGVGGAPMPGPRNSLALPATLNLLADAGANIEAKDPVTEETPLLKAVRFGLIEATGFLIGLEAEVDSQNRIGMSPLMFAAERGSEILVRMVLSGNPDRSLKNRLGQTAYDIAEKRGYRELLDLLRPAAKSVTVVGNEDGSCAPTMVHIMKGEAIDFGLKAPSKMFHFVSRDLDLELMAMPGARDSRVITPQRVGTFEFRCGVHGAPEREGTKGSVMVM